MATALPPSGRTSEDPHEQNRLSWNAATQQHHSHKPDLIQRYKLPDPTTGTYYHNLCDEDIELLLGGGALHGKTVLHLQCNDGQDTVSIARRLRPLKVVGVDISDYAIEVAGQLSAAVTAQMKEDEHTAACTPMVEFVRSDVFTFCESTEMVFDVVYTSYGALCWVSSIERWARGVANVLKPAGGRLVVVDFHPIASAIDPKSNKITDATMGGRPLLTDGVGDYVGNDHEGTFANPFPATEFAWGVGEVASALVAAGLQLESVKEYDYVNRFEMFPAMVPRGEAANRQFYPPASMPKIPLMFSVVAVKR